MFVTLFLLLLWVRLFSFSCFRRLPLVFLLFFFDLFREFVFGLLGLLGLRFFLAKLFLEVGRLGWV